MNNPFSVELPFNFDRYGQFSCYYLSRYSRLLHDEMYQMLDPNNKHNIIYFDVDRATCDSYIVTLDENKKIKIIPSWKENNGVCAETIPTLDFCSDFFSTRQQAEAMAEYLCKRYPVPEEAIIHD